MINAQHAYIYRIHTLHFIFGEIFFLTFYQYSPYLWCVERGERASVKSVADAHNNKIDKIARADRIERRWRGLRSVAPVPARILRRRRETTRGRTTTMTENTQQSNRIRWRYEEDGDGGGNGDPNGKWVKEEEERTTIEGWRRRRGDGGCWWRRWWLWSATMTGDNSGGHNNQPHWWWWVVRRAVLLCQVWSGVRRRCCLGFVFNRMAAIDAHEQQVFEKLLWGLVSSTIFVRW